MGAEVEHRVGVEDLPHRVAGEGEVRKGVGVVSKTEKKWCSRLMALVTKWVDSWKAPPVGAPCLTFSR
jgi:hypothetical protein